MHRLARLAAAFTCLGLLLVGGCNGQDKTGNDSTLPEHSVDPAADQAALAAVEVTGTPGVEPTIDFTPPLTLTDNVARRAAPGTGEVVNVGDAVVVQILAVDGNDGAVVSSSYQSSPELLMVDEAQMPLPVMAALVDSQVGARILYAAPTEAGTTVIWAFEIERVISVPEHAEGTVVEPAPGLPEVYYTDAGLPQITPAMGNPPEQLVVQPLIVGSGEEVREDSKLIIQYIAWFWDGTRAGNSWELGTGVPITLAGSIEGWREGLLGAKIGSEVMLVVPPSMGRQSDLNPADLEGTPTNATMVYIVDILAGI